MQCQINLNTFIFDIYILLYQSWEINLINLWWFMGTQQHCEGSVSQIKPSYVAMYLCILTLKTLPTDLWHSYVCDVFLSSLRFGEKR